jgi:hypothetical protein
MIVSNNTLKMNFGGSIVSGAWEWEFVNFQVWWVFQFILKSESIHLHNQNIWIIVMKWKFKSQNTGGISSDERKLDTGFFEK